MLKKILNLNGTHQLKRDQQAFIKGGVLIHCSRDSDCPPQFSVCSNAGHCFRPQCTSNSDCGAGDICVNYHCQTC
ncbi:hypothetical protein [Aquimarina sp. 2201CG5-10]|uniref:hypothetical protein n=1 Tax=Aquimarina callyspongiae TaxID=3098150 RepID=UPI002AB4FA15|nr:hypothetical protein [Aquimarina sp. 2201CG5-10]MDY8137813.1 hypothetical protein [Aquimarina sp. 2201CG5-10]